MPPQVNQMKLEYARLRVENPKWYAKDCAIKAGYAKTAAASQANRLNKDSVVMKEIARLRDPVLDQCSSRAEDVIKELMLVAYSNIKDYVVVHQETGTAVPKDLEDIPEERCRCIRMVKEKRVIKSGAKGDTVLDSSIDYVLWDKMKALELLAKYHHLLTDKIDHTTAGKPIIKDDGIDRSKFSTSDLKKLIAIKEKAGKGHE